MGRFPEDRCSWEIQIKTETRMLLYASGFSTTLIEDLDDDNDGVLDIYDKFSTDASFSGDYDGDGKPDLVDEDSDGDGVLNVVDAFPLDSSESLDTDGDGIGDNRDNDDDGDGFIDFIDAYPKIAGDLITENDSPTEFNDKSDSLELDTSVLLSLLFISFLISIGLGVAFNRTKSKLNELNNIEEETRV